MYSASSPGPRPMWYCRSPIGVAIRRSRRLSTRVSAFGKTDFLSPMAASLARNSARIVPPANERQANPCVRDACSAVRGPSVGRVGAVGRGRPRLAGGVELDGRGASRGRPDGPRRGLPDGAAPATAGRYVTATDSTVTATSVPTPARPAGPPSGSPRFASVAPVADAAGGAAMGVAVDAGSAAVGSAARAIPAGSETTTATSPSTDSTVPLAFTASSGSMSGRNWAASPSRMTSADAVPSSIRMP